MKRVVVAGNIGVDTNIVLPRGETLRSLAARETHFTTNRDTLGQAGGYSSFGYARLGVPVTFVGSLGDDALGRALANVQEFGTGDRQVKRFFGMRLEHAGERAKVGGAAWNIQGRGVGHRLASIATLGREELIEARLDGSGDLA